MMNDSVDDSASEDLVSEDFSPVLEVSVGGEDSGLVFVPTVQRYTRFTDAWEGNAVTEI